MAFPNRCSRRVLRRGWRGSRGRGLFEARWCWASRYRIANPGQSVFLYCSFKPFHAPEQLSEVNRGHGVSFGSIRINGRCAADLLAIRDVGDHSSMRECLNAIPDAEVPSHAGLSAEHDMVSHRDGAGDTNQGHQQAVPAHGGAMPDRNQVGKLGPGADSCFAHGGSFNRTVSANLNIVF